MAMPVGTASRSGPQETERGAGTHQASTKEAGMFSRSEHRFHRAGPLLVVVALLFGTWVFLQRAKADDLYCRGEKVTVPAYISPGPKPTNGPDIIVGTSGRDVLQGLGGNDLIIGLGGDDLICGGPGQDII